MKLAICPACLLQKATKGTKRIDLLRSLRPLRYLLLSFSRFASVAANLGIHNLGSPVCICVHLWFQFFFLGGYSTRSLKKRIAVCSGDGRTTTCTTRESFAW